MGRKKIEVSWTRFLLQLQHYRILLWREENDQPKNKEADIDRGGIQYTL